MYGADFREALKKAAKLIGYIGKYAGLPTSDFMLDDEALGDGNPAPSYNTYEDDYSPLEPNSSDEPR